jgi:molybdenum cofactor guanylyltransferase
MTMPPRAEAERTPDAVPDAVAESVLGVVLAGGRSSRMGCDKASLVHVNGLTFLQHAIARLRPLVSQVAVSGRVVDDPQVHSIPDQAIESEQSNESDQSGYHGPAVAVWSAVKFAKENGFKSVLVTPVDMPYLESSCLQRVLAAAGKGEPVCVTLEGSKLHPLVAIYPVEYEAELCGEAKSPRRSLRAWFEQRPHRQVDLSKMLVFDVNTPQDLAVSRSRAGLK